MPAVVAACNTRCCDAIARYPVKGHRKSEAHVGLTSAGEHFTHPMLRASVSLTDSVTASLSDKQASHIRHMRVGSGLLGGQPKGKRTAHCYCQYSVGPHY